jgi:hypothetical protein
MSATSQAPTDPGHDPCPRGMPASSDASTASAVTRLNRGEATDAAVFVLTADSPVSAADRDLYAKVAGLSVVTFTVLDKAGHLDAAGLAEAADFTGRVLAEVRAALNGGDPGFGVFAADFTAYLARGRVPDLRASAVAQARR